jgi:uncharacterized protein YceK
MRNTLLILALALSGCAMFKPRCEPAAGTSESGNVGYWEDELMIVEYEE